MLRVTSQERLTLAEVASRVRVHISTVYRWTYHGVRGNRLRSFLVGGRRFVLPDDLQEFLNSGRVSGEMPSLSLAKRQLRTSEISGPASLLDGEE